MRCRLRKYVIRIILMVPIYALDSWLGLRYNSMTIYFDLLRECYEAFVIYSFFTFLTTYLGGDAKIQSFLADKPPLKHSFPLCCLTPWGVSDQHSSFLLQTQLGTL